MSAAVTLSRLTISFGARELVRDLDAVIGPAEVVGLVGPNGCGKTTLLRTIAGAARPGLRVRRPGARRAPAIGYLPQERTHGGTRGGAPGPLTGVRDADDRMRRAADGLERGCPRRRRRLLRGAGGLAGPRRAGPDARIEATLAQVAPGLPLEHPMAGPVRWPVRAGRAGRAAALPVRRLPARRAHQRPRPRRAGAARAVPRRQSGARSSWSATTASSSRAGSPGSWTSTPRWRSWATTAAGSTPTSPSASVRAAGPGGLRRGRRHPEDLRGADARRPGHLRPWGARSPGPSIAPAASTRCCATRWSTARPPAPSAAGRIQRQIERLPEVVEPRREWQLRFRVADGRTLR